MTKLRPPLSYESALARIAALIGWAEIAHIAGCAESTVRAWGDADVPAMIRIDVCEKLDAAYRDAGGLDAPIHQVYTARLQLAALGPDDACIATAAATCSRESGEAVAASIAASSPCSTVADCREAERELEESIASAMATLKAIRRRRYDLEHMAEAA